MPQSLENSKIHKEKFIPLDESTERIARLVVDAAYKVHFNLGQEFLINFNFVRIKDGIRRFVV